MLGGKLERGFLFMIGIYKITSPTKKIYVGQSINIEKRFISYSKLRCKNQIALYRSFLKYGVDEHKFEIICECEDNELNDKERYYQDLYSVIETGLNCILTDTKSQKRVHSLETRERMSKSKKGKKPTEEARLNMQKSSTGRIFSEESKIKMSLAKKGRLASKEHKENLSKALLGRRLSEEHRLKISEYRKSLKKIKHE